MFQPDPRRLVQEVEAGIGCITQPFCFSTQETDDVPFPRLDSAEISDTEKENCIAFAQLCQETLVEIPTFLDHIVFSDECSFSLQVL